MGTDNSRRIAATTGASSSRDCAGRPGLVDLGHELPPHRLGVATHGREFGGAAGGDRHVMLAALGDRPDLAAQIVEGAQHPAEQQEAGTDQGEHQDDHGGRDHVAQPLGQVGEFGEPRAAVGVDRVAEPVGGDHEPVVAQGGLVADREVLG